MDKTDDVKEQTPESIKTDKIDTTESIYPWRRRSLLKEEVYLIIKRVSPLLQVLCLVLIILGLHLSLGVYILKHSFSSFVR